LCEGFEDSAFLKRLCEARGLPHFHIKKASTQPRGGGNTEFGRVLALYRKSNAGFHHLHNVLIITDSDGNTQQAFDRVCAQLGQHAFEVPAAPLQTGQGKPAITVMVLEGNLECFFRSAAASTDAQAAGKVNNFAALVTNGAWEAHKEGKLWLRASLAARCERDPFVTLGSVFTEPRYHPLIPVGHNSFNDLEQVIRRLAVIPNA
jgi:hypothetical protein